ncbi:MAG TPA: DUF1565 domain-containing protein [bacterium]|nr:DUF1565 domain-containing protein [bacterium]
MKPKTVTVLLALSVLLCLACQPDDDDDNDDNNASDDDSSPFDDDTNDDDDTDDDTDDDDTTDDDDDTTDDDDDTTNDDDDTFAPDSPTDEEGVFVAMHGNDANSGTKSAPVRTIARGLALAAEVKKVVFTAQGDYGESVNPTVSLFGGYCSPDWSRDLIDCPAMLQAISIVEVAEPVTIEGMQVTLTEVDRLEAAVLIRSSTVELRRNIIRSDFTDNKIYHATVFGDQANLTLTENLIVSSDAYAPGYYDFGKTTAVELENSTAVLRDNTLHSGDAYGYYLAEMFALEAVNCDLTLVGNELVSGISVGGAIDHSYTMQLESGNALLLNNLLLSQLAWSSTAIFSYNDPEIVLIGNTLISSDSISGNTALSAGEGLTLYAINNIFVADSHSHYSTEGNVIGLWDMPEEETIYLLHNEIFSPKPIPLLYVNYEDVGSIEQINQCEWPMCAQAEGNISRTLQFSPLHDFHLMAGSPCIDTGIDPSPWYDGPEIDFDFEGDARPLGSGWDIGMDEYITPDGGAL